ncbi:unnamed protein product, partial [Ectocarpus sp. 8 AP-2014]
DGEELQYTDGWVTNWAGDSPKDPDKEAGAAVGTMMADTMSAKEKQARRCGCTYTAALSSVSTELYSGYIYCSIFNLCMALQDPGRYSTK